MNRYYVFLFVLFAYLFALIARLTVKLSDWLTPLELLLPITLWVVDLPTVDVFGAELGLNFALFVILLAIVISRFEPEANTLNQGYAFFFGTVGLLLSFVIGHQVGFLYYLSSLVGLTVLSIVMLLLVGFTPEQSLSMSVRYACLTALLALTAGLLLELGLVLDVVLAGVGAYALYAKFSGRIERTELPQGPDEILFRTILLAGKYPEGIATSGLIYAGLFLNLTTLTELFPFFISLVFTQDVLASPSGALLYFTALFQMIFFGVVIIHWMSFLTRVPDSVTYWRGGSKYDYDLEKQAANRPLVRSLMPILVGLMLTEAVQATAQANPLAFVMMGSESVVVYLVIVGATLVYSIAAVPEFGLVRKWIPGSCYLVSNRPRLESDSLTYLAAGIFLTVFYSIVNSNLVILAMAGLLVFYATEIFFTKNVRITLLVGAVFIILLPFSGFVSETGTHIWQILVIFWFAYLLLAVHSTRKEIVETFLRIGFWKGDRS
ncbi:hypothetical protein [Natrialba chahannaoensis]|nr:hypothetical protein [Natrialba chahannaoensis]